MAEIEIVVRPPTVTAKHSPNFGISTGMEAATGREADRESSRGLHSPLAEVLAQKPLKHQQRASVRFDVAQDLPEERARSTSADADRIADLSGLSFQSSAASGVGDGSFALGGVSIDLPEGLETQIVQERLIASTSAASVVSESSMRKQSPLLEKNIGQYRRWPPGTGLVTMIRVALALKKMQKNFRQRARQRIAAEAAYDAAWVDEAEGSTNPFTRVQRKVQAAARMLKIVKGPADADLKKPRRAWSEVPIFCACVAGDPDEVQRLVTIDPEELKLRDDNTATPLHVLMLRSKVNKGARKAAVWIINEHPERVSDKYQNELFRGEVSLHIAMAHRDYELIQMILQASPACAIARTTGAFFSEKNQTYFGEWPLLFAVSTNQPLVLVDLLRVAHTKLGKEQHKMLNVRDTAGNTVFHMSVLHSHPEMFKFLLKLTAQEPYTPECITGGLHRCTNNQGLTPLLLATEKADYNTFSTVLESVFEQQWHWGPYHLRKIWLDEILDTDETELYHLKDGGDRQGVLSILLRTGDFEKLAHPFIAEVLDFMWTNQYRAMYGARARMVIAYVVVFTLANIGIQNIVEPLSVAGAREIWQRLPGVSGGLGPLLDLRGTLHQQGGRAATWTASLWGGAGGNATPAAPEAEPLDTGTLVKFVWFVVHALLRGCIAVVVVGKGMIELAEIQRERKGYFCKAGAALIENIASLGHCGSMVIAYGLWGLHCLSGPQPVAAWLSQILMAPATMFLYFYVIWLLIGNRETGPLVLMLNRMLKNDIRIFAIIFLSIQVAFAQTFHVLMDPNEPRGFFSLLRDCLNVIFHDQRLVDNVDQEATHSPWLTFLLLRGYIVIVVILLLNILIAMMSSTYLNVEEKAEQMWRLERARIMQSLHSPDEEGWWVKEKDTGRRYFQLPNVSQHDVETYQDEADPHYQEALRQVGLLEEVPTESSRYDGSDRSRSRSLHSQSTTKSPSTKIPPQRNDGDYPHQTSGQLPPQLPPSPRPPSASGQSLTTATLAASAAQAFMRRGKRERVASFRSRGGDSFQMRKGGDSLHSQSYYSSWEGRT